MLNIIVGICTCHRPQGLRTLLESLVGQAATAGAKGYPCQLQAVVVDNDLTGLNRDVVEELRPQVDFDILLVEEPKRGISAARNASVRAALEQGCDAFIFMDDDEIASSGWLAAHLAMWQQTGADVVMGPVLAILPENSPAWAVKSGVFDTTIPARSGDRIYHAYTGNTLVSGEALQKLGASFSEDFSFSGGEDRHYFRQAIAQDMTMVWCAEAIVHETVPESRIRLSWLFRRGFRIGTTDARSLRLINPLAMALLKIFIRGSARMAVGCLCFLLSPFGWRFFTLGCKRIAAGAGSFAGLFGARHEEYREIHGG